MGSSLLYGGTSSLGNGMLCDLDLIFLIIWDVARGYMGMFEGFGGFGKGWFFVRL